MSDRKKIGQVSCQERDQILKLHERRNGLAELAKILTIDNKELYEKLVCDMGETSRQYQQWWDDMATKYKWEGSTENSWEIKFETCEIFLCSK